MIISSKKDEITYLQGSLKELSKHIKCQTSIGILVIAK